MTVMLPTHEQILSAYDELTEIYPHVPSMCMWRAMEIAVYRRFGLVEPVLDVGCGDGRFFRLLFPRIRRVTGVDMDQNAVDAARASGVYERLHLAPADQMPVVAESFASAFANCSLEHMDHLPKVLDGVHRALRPGGHFLFSVVNDKLLSWNPIPMLAQALANEAEAKKVTADFIDYHHLSNPLTVEQWMRHLQHAGFKDIKHVPIMPEMCARVFLALDTLWHVADPNRPGSEIGGALEPYFARFPQFPCTFRMVFAGLLKMEANPTVGCGAVFMARKAG